MKNNNIFNKYFRKKYKMKSNNKLMNNWKKKTCF